MEANKLIADFMGLYPNPHDNGVTFATETKTIDGQVYGDKWLVPDYKNSWDWLMPVIEKIELSGKYCLKIISTPTMSGRWFSHRISIFENSFKGHDKPMIEIQSYYNKKESKMSTCYRFVIEFIKWYNQSL